mmetsp:Transcript_129880/g.376049  ORF Transcript_129880/g.376049 Transcript_129880/m.376049 type:complete len:316 (+) Transcript_129880:521-1468(+)
MAGRKRDGAVARVTRGRRSRGCGVALAVFQHRRRAQLALRVASAARLGVGERRHDGRAHRLAPGLLLAAVLQRPRAADVGQALRRRRLRDDAAYLRWQVAVLLAADVHIGRGGVLRWLREGRPGAARVRPRIRARGECRAAPGGLPERRRQRHRRRRRRGWPCGRTADCAVREPPAVGAHPLPAPEPHGARAAAGGVGAVPRGPPGAVALGECPAAAPKLPGGSPHLQHRLPGRRHQRLADDILPVGVSRRARGFLLVFLAVPRRLCTEVLAVGGPMEAGGAARAHGAAGLPGPTELLPFRGLRRPHRRERGACG